MKFQARIVQFALLIACLLSLTSSALAQSTLFNIPSSDVQPSRSVYLETDFITHFAAYANGGYQTYGERVVVGVPGNIEVGANVYYTRASSAQPIIVQPNIKWQFYHNEKIGVDIAAGALLSTPVTHRSDGSTTGMVYLVGSKSFSGARAPRLTFGGYQLLGRFEAGTDKSGVMAAIEQPVTKKFSVLTDWFSGKNSFGYVTPGVAFTFSPKDNIYAGYSIGNQGRGNNSLGVYYGHTF